MGWVYEQLIFVELLTFVVESILVMRRKHTSPELMPRNDVPDRNEVYVLYNQNKLILWTIILAFVVEVILMVACLSIVLPRMTFSSDCLVASAPGFFVSYWYVLSCLNLKLKYIELQRAKAVLSCIRDFPFYLDFDQVFSKYLKKYIVHSIHLRARRHVGLCLDIR